MATSVTPISEARSFATRREVRSGRISVLLLLPVVVLLIIGLGALLSASSVLAIREGFDDNLYYFKRQVLFAAIGLVCLIVGARIPYRWYQRAAVPIFVVAVAGLIATLIFGDVRGGAQRWIELGPVTIQASEFAKFAVVVMLAAVLTRKSSYLGSFGHVFWPVAATLGLIGGLLMLQPDFGTTVLVSASALAVLFASSARIRDILALSTLGLVAGGLLAVAEPYRLERLTAFLDANPDVLGDGYHAHQSLVALGTGGWFGVGLGASRARWSFLPNAHSDFIFSIIGEETGLAGSLAVIALFIVMAVVGIAIAYRAQDSFGRLLATGLVAWLTFQALVNIGGVVKVLPITGVPLPFVSAGGSAMMANLFVVGVLINVARLSAKAPPEAGGRR
ncbi:MAG: putative lipid II flippase FtsW [Acidimicrobiia bacterium]|nr:putative lipid II flippase FtsW [Acidimicrobiia bacterium]